jgi:hypothetical protein
MFLQEVIAFDGVRFYNQYWNYSCNRTILPSGNADFSGCKNCVRKSFLSLFARPLSLYPIKYCSMLRCNYFIGTIKEGDYLIQAGVYSLVGVDIATALELVERAYQDGRKVYFSSILLIIYVLFYLESFICCCSSTKIRCYKKSNEPLN